MTAYMPMNIVSHSLISESQKDSQSKTATARRRFYFIAHQPMAPLVTARVLHHFYDIPVYYKISRHILTYMIYNLLNVSIYNDEAE
jgi:hypothetical protein